MVVVATREVEVTANFHSVHTHLANFAGCRVTRVSVLDNFAQIVGLRPQSIYSDVKVLFGNIWQTDWGVVPVNTYVLLSCVRLIFS